MGGGVGKRVRRRGGEDVITFWADKKANLLSYRPRFFKFDTKSKTLTYRNDTNSKPKGRITVSSVDISQKDTITILGGSDDKPIIIKRETITKEFSGELDSAYVSYVIKKLQNTFDITIVNNLDPPRTTTKILTNFQPPVSINKLKEEITSQDTSQDIILQNQVNQRVMLDTDILSTHTTLLMHPATRTIKYRPATVPHLIQTIPFATSMTHTKPLGQLYNIKYTDTDVRFKYYKTNNPSSVTPITLHQPPFRVGKDDKTVTISNSSGITYDIQFQDDELPQELYSFLKARIPTQTLYITLSDIPEQQQIQESQMGIPARYNQF